jgi:hypothetical protein
MSPSRFGVACALALTSVAALPARAADLAAETGYVVQPGDTLSGLAQTYFNRLSDWRVVQQRNHIPNPRRMRSGAVLYVPTTLLRTEPVVARLGFFSGPVTVSDGGRALPVTLDMALNEGLLITTGANAFARLDLPDGSRMALPSQSQVRINQLHRTVMTKATQRVFTVEAGRGVSTVTPLKNDQDSFVVRTPRSVSAVRGTEFRVHYDPDHDQAATEVVKGTVMVAANGADAVAIGAGFGVSADPKDSRPPVVLLPAPALLDANKVFDGAGFDLHVAPSDQAQAYRVQLAADAGFLGMIAEATNPDPQVRFNPVPDGVYFVRLSLISADGLEGLASTYAIDRVLNTLTLHPETTSGGGRQRRYLFRWDAGGDGSRTYRFQLMRDKAPTPVIDETGLIDPQLTVTDLPPGLYAWRVMSRTSRQDHAVDKWSQVQSFHVGD